MRILRSLPLVAAGAFQLAFVSRLATFGVGPLGLALHAAYALPLLAAGALLAKGGRARGATAALAASAAFDVAAFATDAGPGIAFLVPSVVELIALGLLAAAYHGGDEDEGLAQLGFLTLAIAYAGNVVLIASRSGLAWVILWNLAIAIAAGVAVRTPRADAHADARPGASEGS